MKAFRVLLSGKEIDKVFYADNFPISVEEVKNSLVNHDGYHPNIVVVKEKGRK